MKTKTASTATITRVKNRITYNDKETREETREFINKHRKAFDNLAER